MMRATGGFASTDVHSVDSGLLWSVNRHIGLVVLIGLAVFASSAVLLWSALGFPATAASRLEIIKVALTVVVSGGEVWFRGARFTGGEVDLSEAVISVAPVFDEGEKPGLKLP